MMDDVLGAEEERFTLRTLLNIAQVNQDPALWVASLQQEVTALTAMCEDGKVVTVLMKYHAFEILQKIFELPYQQGLQECILRLLNSTLAFKVCMQCLADNESLVNSTVELYVKLLDGDTLLEVYHVWLAVATALEHAEGPHARDEPALSRLVLDDEYYRAERREDGEDEEKPAQRVFEQLLAAFRRDSPAHDKMVAVLNSSLRGDVLTTGIDLLTSMCETELADGGLFGRHMATPQLVAATLEAVELLRDRDLLTSATAQKCVQLWAEFTRHEAGGRAVVAHRPRLETTLVALLRRHFPVCLEDTVVVLGYLTREAADISEAAVMPMLDMLEQVLRWCRGLLDWEPIIECDNFEGDNQESAAILKEYFSRMVEWDGQLETGGLRPEWKARIQQLLAEEVGQIRVA